MMKKSCGPVSRRMFLSAGTAGIAAALVASRKVSAQALAHAQPALVVQARAAAAAAKITYQALRRNVAVLMGSGGNIAVLPGADGTLLVDSGFSTSKPQILEALAAHGSSSIRHLINTHWHFDHTDGNEWIHAAGATITAQENTRTRLSTPQEIAAFHASFPPAPAGAVPTLVFATEKSMQVNGAALQLRHYDPAHTDTDLSVLFTEAGVLHAGDTWFNGFYPFIDYSTGGNIDGMITATARNLKTAADDTIIIPGHGPVGIKPELAEYHEMLMGTREKVAQLKRQGRSIEEAIAAKPTAAYDAKWGHGMMKAEAFTRLVYAGV